MWLIRLFHRELTGYYTDDPGVFSRKVVDGGKSLSTAHPDGWTQHIINCTIAEAVEFHRDELAKIYQQLVDWRLLAEIPPALAESEQES